MPLMLQPSSVVRSVAADPYRFRTGRSLTFRLQSRLLMTGGASCPDRSTLRTYVCIRKREQEKKKLASVKDETYCVILVQPQAVLLPRAIWFRSMENIDLPSRNVPRKFSFLMQ